MPRKRTADCWQHFVDVEDKGEFKRPRVSCIYCGDTMTASCEAMRNHLHNSCEKMPTSIGRLPVSSNVGARASPTSAHEVVRQLKERPTPCFSRTERDSLDQAFANAVHQTGAPFSLFDHPAWSEFFQMATPTWTAPTPTRISNDLLASHYDTVMQHMRDKLADATALTIGVDGATNAHSKTTTNVVAFDPRPWFVEFLRTGLAKQTADWLTRSIQDAAVRIDNFVGKKVVRSFISDSCNAMRAVRRSLVDKHTVDFAYGCAAHALNNVCEDIVKMTAVKECVRRAMFIAVSIRR